MKILITGSEGLIGKIVQNSLKSEYALTCLDSKAGVDILKTDIKPYFRDIDTVIHLAAIASIFIEKEDAEKNIAMSEKVLEACRDYNIKTILNASSINVYPYPAIFLAGKNINYSTPLSPNTFYGKEIKTSGEYGRAKISIEKLFEDFARENKKGLVNLRFGAVFPDNKVNENGPIPALEPHIFLNQKDLLKIIRANLSYSGIANYVCVSKKDGLFNESIRFPLEKFYQ